MSTHTIIVLIIGLLTYVFPAVILLCVYKYDVYGLAMFFCLCLLSFLFNIVLHGIGLNKFEFEKITTFKMEDQRGIITIDIISLIISMIITEA